MTTQETILQAVRDWYQAASALTDAQVIVYQDKGPRPALPYLAVDVALDQDRAGELSLVEALGQVTATGWKVARVTVYAFGEAAQAWLEDADQERRTTVVAAIFTAASIVVRPAGPGSDLTAVLDTSFEPRMAAVWDVYYAEVADAYTAVALGTSQEWRTLYNAVRTAVEAISGLNESATPFDENTAPALAALAGSNRLFYVTVGSSEDTGGDRQAVRVRTGHAVVVNLLVEIPQMGSVDYAFQRLLDDERAIQNAIVTGSGCRAYRPRWNRTERQIATSRRYIVSQSVFGLVHTHALAVTP